MDKKLLLSIFIIGVLVGSIVTITYSRLSTPQAEVYFSPNGGCEQIILYYISQAKSSIHILMFSFTLDNVANALIDSYERGVDVKVLFEDEQIYSYDIYWRLKNAGIDVRNDTNPSFMHNKIAIIDDKIVLTGSYNWTDSAETVNNENLLMIKDREIAENYEVEFQKLWNQL